MITTSQPDRPRWHSPVVIVAKVLFVLVLPLAGTPGHAATFAILAGWAFLGPRRAIEALTLAWLASFLNPGIYSLSGHADMLRWVILGGGVFSVMRCMIFDESNQRLAVPPAWSAVLLFCAVAGALSLYGSYIPDVSLTMLVMFLIGTTTVLFGFHLTNHLLGYWQDWFLIFFSVIVVVSFFLIVHPLGYVRVSSSFQGLTNQPQVYGIFLAPFLSWLFALLLTRRVQGVVWLGVLAIGAVSLIATDSRTGAFAAFLGFSLVLIWKYVQLPSVRGLVSRWIPGALVVLFVGFTGLMISETDMRGRVIEFVMKTNVEEFEGLDLGETTRTRRMLTDLSMANFREQRMTGIGFGVPSNPPYAVVRNEMERAGPLGMSVEDRFPENFSYPRDPFFGIPLAGSTEKGTTVTAVLEEVGLIGFMFFLLLVAALLLPLFQPSGGLAPAALALSAILVNFGEAVFFSFGGSGLLIWLLLGLAYTEGLRAKTHPVKSSQVVA